jgi:hypothetical protein
VTNLVQNCPVWKEFSVFKKSGSEVKFSEEIVDTLLTANLQFPQFTVGIVSTVLPLVIRDRDLDFEFFGVGKSEEQKQRSRSYFESSLLSEKQLLRIGIAMNIAHSAVKLKGELARGKAQGIPYYLKGTEVDKTQEPWKRAIHEENAVEPKRLQSLFQGAVRRAVLSLNYLIYQRIKRLGDNPGIVSTNRFHPPLEPLKSYYRNTSYQTDICENLISSINLERILSSPEIRKFQLSWKETLSSAERENIDGPSYMQEFRKIILDGTKSSEVVNDPNMEILMDAIGMANL